MSDLSGVLIQHRTRIHEIAVVLARYGFSSLADLATAAAANGQPSTTERLLARIVDPEIAAMSLGERLCAAFTELGATFVKFGQMLSQRPDIVGNAIAEPLLSLQTAVPPDAPGAAESRIESELGRPIEDIFTEFDPAPLASASIAQVHQAALPDGTKVVVKVIHAGTETRVLADLELMKALAGFLEGAAPELATYHPVALVAEFDAMMRDAIDFRVELGSQQHFEQAFADIEDVLVPHPYRELSGSGVLTMDLVEGYRVSSREDLLAQGFDVDAMVQRTVDIFLEMLFGGGIFHADPHPGNLLLQPPRRIALLDYGDIGRLTPIRRSQVEELVLAVALHNSDSLADAMLAICKAPPTVDREAFAGQVDLWMSRNLAAGMGEYNVAALVRGGAEILRAHGLHLPSDLVLVFRVLIRLQGLAQSLGVQTTVREALQPFLGEMIKHRFEPRRIAHDLARTLRSWDQLMKELPDDVRSVLSQLSRGQVAVELQLHDPDQAVDRVVDGLIAGSSLLAGALLWSRRAGPTVGGISAPGVLAAAVGVGTWVRLASRRVGHRDGLTRTVDLARTLVRLRPRRRS